MFQSKPAQVQLGKITPVDPRIVWPKEEKDFTPWLADNIGELSEAVGIELEVKEKEKKVGNYELDIYAVDKDNPDNVIIIENQLTETDHKHLGQLMAYAAGLDARFVIWICPEIRDEHKVTIEWLNQITTESVGFFLVRVEVIRVDNSLPAVRFEVEVAPSEFEREFENAKPKLPSISPKQISWNDSLGNPITVLTWKDVFLKTVERAIQEKVDFQSLPIKTSLNSADFRGSINLNIAGQTTFIDSHGSASELRRKASSILKALGKPAKFLRIECENDSIFELP
jgi:hypothetical protein